MTTAMRLEISEVCGLGFPDAASACFIAFQNRKAPRAAKRTASVRKNVKNPIKSQWGNRFAYCIPSPWWVARPNAEAIGSRTAMASAKSRAGMRAIRGSMLGLLTQFAKNPGTE